MVAAHGTHSLGRTASVIYKRTGNLRAMQSLLGHTNFESTVFYLGFDGEDALALPGAGLVGVPFQPALPFCVSVLHPGQCPLSRAARAFLSALREERNAVLAARPAPFGR